MFRKIISKILIKVNLIVFFRLADINIIFFFLKVYLYNILFFEILRFICKFIFDIFSLEDKCDVYFFFNWFNYINGKLLFYILDNEWRCEINLFIEYI